METTPNALNVPATNSTTPSLDGNPTSRTDNGNTEEAPPVFKSKSEINKERFAKETEELNKKFEEDKKAKLDAKHEKPKASNNEDGDSGKDAPKEKESDSEPMLKLKVNGNEVKLKQSEVIKRAQLYEASEQKFQKASQIQRQAENFIKTLKSNPKAVLQHEALGLNIKEIAEDILYDYIQQESKSPEELEYAKEKSELERYREMERQRTEQLRQQQIEDTKERYRAEWTTKITEALGTSNLPKTDWTVSRMAQYMRQALQQGMNHIQPKDVVNFVREDWIAAQKDMYSSMSSEELAALLGEEVTDKLRKNNLNKFNNAPKKVSSPEIVDDVDENPDVSYNSLDDMIRKQTARLRK